MRYLKPFPFLSPYIVQCTTYVGLFILTSSYHGGVTLYNPKGSPDALSPPHTYLQAMDEPNPAHTAYSASLCMWNQNPDAWHAWGSHCDRYVQNMGV